MYFLKIFMCWHHHDWETPLHQPQHERKLQNFFHSVGPTKNSIPSKKVWSLSEVQESCTFTLIDVQLKSFEETQGQEE